MVRRASGKILLITETFSELQFFGLIDAVFGLNIFVIVKKAIKMIQKLGLLTILPEQNIS